MATITLMLLSSMNLKLKQISLIRLRVVSRDTVIIYILNKPTLSGTAFATPRLIQPKQVIIFTFEANFLLNYSIKNMLNVVLDIFTKSTLTTS